MTAGPGWPGQRFSLVPIALLWRRAASVCFSPPKQFTLVACPLPQHGLAALLAREWRRILASDYCEFHVTTRIRSPAWDREVPSCLEHCVKLLPEC